MSCAKELHDLNIHYSKKYPLLIWFQSVIFTAVKVFTPEADAGLKMCIWKI